MSRLCIGGDWCFNCDLLLEFKGPPWSNSAAITPFTGWGRAVTPFTGCSQSVVPAVFMSLLPVAPSEKVTQWNEKEDDKDNGNDDTSGACTWEPTITGTTCKWGLDNLVPLYWKLIAICHNEHTKCLLLTGTDKHLTTSDSYYLLWSATTSVSNGAESPTCGEHVIRGSTVHASQPNGFHSTLLVKQAGKQITASSVARNRTVTKQQVEEKIQVSVL